MKSSKQDIFVQAKQQKTIAPEDTLKYFIKDTSISVFRMLKAHVSHKMV